MGQSQLLSDHVFHTGANAGKDVPAKEPSSRRTVWRDIATRFIEPRECLASFLALESAEVVAGIKPANLFSIPNRTYACGRNPYQLWKKWGKTVVATTPLEAYELTDREILCCFSFIAPMRSPISSKNPLFVPSWLAQVMRKRWLSHRCSLDLPGVLLPTGFPMRSVFSSDTP